MRLKTTIFLAVFLFVSASCAQAQLSITCSMFPVYDFAREVTRDLADVKLLLKPGTEPHEFEPSPLDVKALNDSDVFIFTNPLMEEWAERVSRSLTHTLIINASENITLTDNDPHVWLDLSLAQSMVANIAAGISRADPEHEQDYSRNAEAYIHRLAEMDTKFRDMKKTRALVFGGEFACGYFVRRYGFEYVSAYDGENEPSVRRMAEVMRFIRENGTRFIFTDAGSPSRITLSLASETGTEILTFNSAHMAPEGDATFMDIMSANYMNVSRAMND